MRLGNHVTDRGTGTNPSFPASAPLREPCAPVSEERGLASADIQVACEHTLQSWKGFRDELRELSDAGRFDTQLRSTSTAGRHHTVRDLAIGIGAWPEARTIEVIAAEARAGLIGDFDHDPLTDELRSRYTDQPDAAILAAVDETVDQLERWVDAHAQTSEALLPVRSLLGTLPTITLLHAACYQLAVYAVDIQASGSSRAPMPPAATELKFFGVSALVDVTGAIAARQGVAAAIAARTPDGVAAMRSATTGAWRTVLLDPDTVVDAPSVTASTKTFIEVTTGRIGNIPALMLRRELQLDDIPGLLHVTPVLEGVPGLPGGAALRAATTSVRAMAGIGGRLGRLTHLGRRQ